MIESAGIPMPEETVLLSGTVHSGTRHPATTYAYACAFAIETTTVNGTGVSTPYNPIPGSAPIHCGLDIDYIGTSNWSGSFSAPANGGPAIQIRGNQSEQWDVGIGFMDSATGHLGSIYKASIQDDTQAISLFLATANSNHQYGLNWGAASFSVASITCPAFECLAAPGRRWWARWASPRAPSSASTGRREPEDPGKIHLVAESPEPATRVP